jgi:hypothetical protein
MMRFSASRCLHLLTAAALAAAGLALALPVASGESTASEGEWRAFTPEWDIKAVGPGERSLVIVDTAGWCGASRNLKAAVRETSTNVIVALSAEDETLPPGSTLPPCLPPRAEPFVVPLRRRLAGRRVRGRDPRIAASPGTEFAREPVRTVPVPNVVGFAPPDAERALERVELTEHAIRVRPARGLTRVIAQRPAAGSRLRRGTGEQLTLAGR